MEFVSRFYCKANSLFVLNCTCKWSGFGRLREITEAQAILSHHLAPLLLEELGLSPEIDVNKNSQILCPAERKKKKKKKKTEGKGKPSPWDSSEWKQEEGGESGHWRISRGTRVFRMEDRTPPVQRSGLGEQTGEAVKAREGGTEGGAEEPREESEAPVSVWRAHKGGCRPGVVRSSEPPQQGGRLAIFCACACASRSAVFDPLLPHGFYLLPHRFRVASALRRSARADPELYLGGGDQQPPLEVSAA